MTDTNSYTRSSRGSNSEVGAAEAEKEADGEEAGAEDAPAPPAAEAGAGETAAEV